MFILQILRHRVQGHPKYHVGVYCRDQVFNTCTAGYEQRWWQWALWDKITADVLLLQYCSTMKSVYCLPLQKKNSINKMQNYYHIKNGRGPHFGSGYYPCLTTTRSGVFFLVYFSFSLVYLKGDDFIKHMITQKSQSLPETVQTPGLTSGFQ